MLPNIFGEAKGVLLSIGLKSCDFLLHFLTGITGYKLIGTRQHIGRLNIITMTGHYIIIISWLIGINGNRIIAIALHIGRHERPSPVFKNKVSEDSMLVFGFIQCLSQLPGITLGFAIELIRAR